MAIPAFGVRTREAAPDADDVLAELGGPSRFWRRLGTPALLAAACVALYLYVRNQDLDRISQASLNADTIRAKLIEHVELTFVSTLIVVLLAVPLGVMLTRPAVRRFSPVVLAVANIGQAIPSIGVLVLMAITVGIGFDQAVYALVIYAALPVLRNTIVGLNQVDRMLVEAGRGIGLSGWQVLRRVELPLSVPVLLAGIRTALIINVGTATLATFVGAGGLGFLIDQGIRFDRMPVLVTGSVLTAVLALLLDWVAGMVEDALRPKGL
ncbi:ABC transporter permease [Micromonospora avicenniae]|uniref:Osmoprotectant transport system permease protein n=1 Tax=Micromonospora avicenniae TaxID=1198245 RepID=A0A1N7DE93_9ACTN|nr:ABC transporter permease [Micromonospora avicenniae]SIR74163.1 osmoprotectant transport system permease protein [Micromonospora avicenniae]